jgi:hypothetical protein
MSAMFMSMLCLLIEMVQAVPSKFLQWSTNHAKNCGVPTAVLAMPNLYPCVTELSAVMAFHTVFEGNMHTFGVTACSDNQIYLGVRTEDSILTYMEFVAFNDFMAFMKECVFTGVACTREQKVSLLHLTVSNKPHPGLDALRLSSLKYGVQTRVLGMGNSTAIGHGGFGFGLKLSLLHRELRVLPPETIVLFTDAFDVLIQKELSPLLEWCKNNPQKVLFAAESSKWPCKELMYPSPLHFPYPYLNSGVFCGEASSILALLDSVEYSQKTDDQEYYTRQFLEKNTIVLDHRADYFQCLVGVSEKDLEFGEKLQVHHFDGLKRWSTTPAVLHLNNGFTRFKLFTRCIHTVLGPSYSYLSRQIIVSIVLDFLTYNRATLQKVIYCLVALVLFWKFWKFSAPTTGGVQPV